MRKAVRDALKECERDDVGQCATCTSLALDGEQYCLHCKDYWENDVPAMMERADQEFWEQLDDERWHQIEPPDIHPVAPVTLSTEPQAPTPKL